MKKPMARTLSRDQKVISQGQKKSRVYVLDLEKRKQEIMVNALEPMTSS